MQFIKLCDFCYIVKQTVNKGNKSESFLSAFLNCLMFHLDFIYETIFKKTLN